MTTAATTLDRRLAFDELATGRRSLEGIRGRRSLETGGAVVSTLGGTIRGILLTTSERRSASSTLMPESSGSDGIRPRQRYMRMSEGGGDRPAVLEILLVEDNPGDVRLTKEALRMTPIEHRFHVVTDGTEALDFLHGRGEYADAPCPDLVLLDFKLPRLNGDEVAAELDETADLGEIPLIVLTGHPAQDSVLGIDELPVDAAITKPVDADEFLETIDSLELQ